MRRFMRNAWRQRLKAALLEIESRTDILLGFEWIERVLLGFEGDLVLFGRLNFNRICCWGGGLELVPVAVRLRRSRGYSGHSYQARELDCFGQRTSQSLIIARPRKHVTRGIQR